MVKKIERWQGVVFIASLVQLLSPALITALGFSVSSASSDPQITPAGYAFIVWGAITLLSFAYGVYQLFPGRLNRVLHYELSRGLAMVYLLFAGWLTAAILQWLAITVAIFAMMFGILVLIFQKLLEERSKLGRVERIILLGQVAIYTGWTTVAIFANTASAIKYYGVTDTGIVGMAWQALILLLALVHGKYWLRKFRTNTVFGLTLVWALAGILFGLMQYDNNMPLRLITFFGITLVVSHLIFKTSLKTARG
jgi:hypothetical protein